MKRIVLKGIFALGLLIFGGCASSQINPLEYQGEIKEKVKIPDVCMQLYKSAIPNVAVVDFTNNSTYGDAKISQSLSNTKTHGVIGGVGFSNVIIGSGVATSQTITNTSNRTTDAKLGESVASMIEEHLFSNGGVKLITRSDMNKINSELILQDSGLLDPKTVVEFGKSSGVQYIVTGSIDNIEHHYRDNGSIANTINLHTNRSDDKNTRLIGGLLKITADLTDGLFIKSKITVRILEVATGKIIISKSLEKDINIGRFSNPTYDHIVGGIKQAISESLPELDAIFAQVFEVRGYISKLKTNGKDTIAQVSIGRNHRVEENTEFMIYAFDENIDPMNGQKSCDIIVLPTKLKATNQISSSSSWTTIDGDANGLKLNQLVQKSYTKGGFSVLRFK